MKKIKGDKESEILTAAVRVFAKNGFHKSKMATIAEEAGVSAGTLYNYFSDKDHMFDRIFDEVCKAFYAGIEPLQVRDDFSSLEKLEGAVDLIFDILGPHPDLITVFANEFEPRIKEGHPSFIDDYNRFKEVLVSLIRQGAEEKCFNPHIPPVLACEFFIGGIKRIIYAMALEPDRFSLSIMRQNVKLLIRKGILINEE